MGNGPQRPLADMWNTVMARRGIQPAAPEPAPAPPPVAPVTQVVPTQADVNAGAAAFGAPPPAAPAPTPKLTVNSLVDQWIAKHGSAPATNAPVAGPSQAEADDAAYRARQAASYAPKEQRDAAAAAAAPPPAPTNIKFNTPGAPGSPGAAAPSDINWNRGGGGVANVPAATRALVNPVLQDELLGSIGKQKEAVGGQKEAVKASAEAQGEVKRQEAIGEREIAKTHADAGTDVKLRAQEAADQSKAYLAHIDEFSKKVAQDRINPNKMYDEASTPTRITWAIASGLGAAAQGLLRQGSNHVVDMIQNAAAQDIAAQKANHDINRERLGDMHNAYSMAMQATGRKEEAERVAMGYALEGAKHDLNALVANSQSDVAKAEGAKIEAALTERQAQLSTSGVEKEIGMNQWVPAHQVASGPDMKEVYKSARAYTDDQAKLGTIVTPDQAIQWAYKMHTGVNPLQGQGFTQGAKLEGANKELKETQVATDEFNKQIENLRKDSVIVGSGLGTAAGAHLPQRIAPESNDAQQQLHAINTRMLQAIGKVAKDADGKPNKTMIEKIEQKFEIHLSDSPAIKQQKLTGIADVYNSLAREQGAKAPEPTTGPAPGFKP